MMFEPDVVLRADEKVNETLILFDKIRKVFYECEDYISQIKSRDTECIIVDFDSVLNSFGRYDKLNDLGLQVSGFENTPDYQKGSRMWLRSLP